MELGNSNLADPFQVNVNELGDHSNNWMPTDEFLTHAFWKLQGYNNGAGNARIFLHLNPTTI